ncbi:MAG: glycoside hydrolase family 127 protein [Marinilabiliales bacterium]|nr:glycoside hydrolase family 127 protein [Marinilabiliales bacterium]
MYQLIVGKGTKVTITEETEYPFRGIVKMTVNTGKSVRFPLHLRIPGWETATIKWRGKTGKGIPGSTAILDEKWNNGDEIMIEFPFEYKV